MKKKILIVIIIVILAGGLIFLTSHMSKKNNDMGDTSTTQENKETNTNKVTEGVLSKIVTADNYGDKINYSANGIDDWKIFYNDGENVFIITSEVVPNTKLSTKLGLKSSSKQVHCASWDYNSQDLLKYNGVLSVDTNIAEKYQLEWINKYGKTLSQNNTNEYTGKLKQYSVNVVASLTDQENWSSFINTNYAESAIGGPSLEMLVKSWNATGRTKLYCNNNNKYGNYIGFTDTPTTEHIYITDFEDESEFENATLYAVDGGFGGQDAGQGYLIVTPNASNADDLYIMNTHAIRGGISENGDSTGLRPVVCLKNDVSGTSTGNGTWDLK